MHRRTWLIALPAWWSCTLAAASEPAPRLRFRTRRAICDCAGDTDEEAIERAAEARRAPAASAGPASSAADARKDDRKKPDRPDAPAPDDKSNPRRQAP